MSRIIPGVQVTVIKEVVPPQLAPSGVLGLLGIVAPARDGIERLDVERVGSWGRFRELYGSATALAMPEAQAALQNGVYELVVVAVDDQQATAATALVDYREQRAWLSFSARASGTAPNRIKVTLADQVFQGKVTGYELRLRREGDKEDLEVHRNLSPFPGSERWFGRVLTATDSILDAAPPTWVVTNYADEVIVDATTPTTTVVKVGGVSVLDVNVEEVEEGAPQALHFSTVEDTLEVRRNGSVILSIKSDDPELPQRVIEAIAKLPDANTTVTLPDLSTVTVTLDGGEDAPVAAYVEALERLVDVPDVDLVIASVQHLTIERAASIYGAVIAHCETMSADAKGRLGFGQVPAKDSSMAKDIDLVRSLVSDRFTLFAPHGTLGAAVGRIASLPYYHSPTFKTLAGLGTIKPALRVEAQRQYLTEKIVPVAELQGRGNVIVRGITTDGDQINVRRIADRAVRGVKQIGELFIGKLNTADGRNALKQKLNEFLLQMAAESAIVPKTDGSDPAYKLDVYSTQADFALGIVRVDMAIRPVRAIDYIYATVLVQV